MRLLRAVLISLCCAFSVSAADLQIVRVWPSYRTGDTFMRISEYFSGKENTGGQEILRTQPAERAGYYFLTRINNSGPAIAGARLELQIITPAATDAKTYAFTADLPAGKKVFQLGLTGSDWTEPKHHPVAWLLRFVTPDGTEIAREESYLWSQPSAK